MIVLRGLAAVLLGLAAAAVANGVLLLAVAAMSGSGSGIDASVRRFLLFVVMAGPVLTAPAWLLFCLLVLPVVTHRARIGRRFPDGPLAAAAVAAGAALILPLALFLGIDAAMLPLFALFGGVGGAAIITAWRFLVLDRVTPRHPATHGVSLG